MSKVVFVDVDGTLVDYENHLPASAVKAIRKARENGHLVFICTGRSKAEVYSEIWNIGLSGFHRRISGLESWYMGRCW